MKKRKTTIYPWVVWGLGAGFFLLQYIIRISPGVMHPELARAFGINGYQFGLLAAFFYWPYIIMQIPVGVLLDRFSIRYLVAVAILITAFGAILFATTHNIYVANFARFMLGFGSSFSFIGGIKLAANWFDRKYFGMLAGATQGLGMFGAAFGNTIVAVIVIHIGWRHAIWLLAGLFILLFFLVFVFVRDFPKNHPARRSLSSRKKPSLVSSLLTVSKSFQTWINSLYVGVMYAPSTAFAALWGVSFLERAYGIRREFAAAAVGAMYLGWALGSPLLGFISDRIGRRKPVLFCSALLATLILSLVIYSPSIHPGWLFGLLFVYGMANSGATLSYAVASEQHLREFAGTSVSIANMASIIVGALCLPFIGWILDELWSGKFVHGVRYFSIKDFQIAMSSLVVLLAIGLISSLFIKETHCRNPE